VALFKRQRTHCHRRYLIRCELTVLTLELSAFTLHVCDQATRRCSNHSDLETRVKVRLPSGFVALRRPSE
jgi:hypothetical protein